MGDTDNIKETMEEPIKETTKENEKTVTVWKCSYRVNGPPHYCDFRTPRLDVLQLHIKDEHYRADCENYIRLKLFDKYPNSCELCSDDEGRPMFYTPVERFEHLVSEHLAFTLALCPVCCRIFKGLKETTYHYHLKCYHSLEAIAASCSHILHLDKERQISIRENRLRAKNWGKKVYRPYLKLVSHVETSLKRGNERFDPEAYVNSIPEIEREFICKLLQLPEPQLP